MAIGTYLQKLLNVWNIRSMMLLSLIIQMVLTYASPYRRTSRSWAPGVVWSTYLLADSAAIYTTGLISNTVRTSSSNPLQVNQDILALWASILLVHMGGPDTITAYSLEDNSLWLRHIVRLVGQLAAISYILLKTSAENNILVPTLLVLILGVVKYSERTRALFLARLENLKNSVSGKRLIKELPKEDISVSYYFYERFRGMIVDVMPSPSELEQGRKFFMETSPETALAVISGELHMIYEVLYTRFVAIYSNLGDLISAIYGYAIMAALVLFCLSRKNWFDGVDVNITYCLLSGLLIVNYSRAFMPYSSAMARVEELNAKGCFSFIKWITVMLVSFCITLKPWSRRMGAFNLLDCTIQHCLAQKKRKNKAIKCCGGLFGKAIDRCGLKDWLDKMTHTSTNCFLYELWDFIFEGLKRKASKIQSEEQAREVYESKGESALQEMNLTDLEKSYMKDFDYGKALLCWHIATEICFNVDEDKNNENRERSKILSDYLMYLLIHQPKLTAAVAGITHERYADTCLEVEESANRRGVENLKEFCAKALEVEANVDQENGEGGYNREQVEEQNDDAETGGSGLYGKSLFHDACNLAMILRNRNNKWEIIAGVWEEMLSYAAGHCRGNEHARTVSNGGELLTHVWLLMAHFGITAQWPKN